MRRNGLLKQPCRSPDGKQSLSQHESMAGRYFECAFPSLPCMLDNDLHAVNALERSGRMYQPPRRHKQTDAMSWLHQSQHGASVLATAKKLLELQALVQASLPAPLNTACQIVRWQDETLTLSVPSAAHSAKLRQVVPRLAAALQKHGWQVNEIRVRVQAAPRFPEPPAAVPRDQRPQITPDGVARSEERRV